MHKMTPSLSKIHARFDRYGVNEWVARADAPVGADCQHLCELSPAGYDRVFRLMGKSGRGSLTVLGAGCGRGMAHAVAGGYFSKAAGFEIVPKRAAAAHEALRDLGLEKRVTVTLGNFSGKRVETKSVFLFDIAFDSATTAGAAAAIEASPHVRSFVSFKPPCKWLGLPKFSLVESGRVRTSGEEAFTYYFYKKSSA
jgi:hypothetical protein